MKNGASLLRREGASPLRRRFRLGFGLFGAGSLFLVAACGWDPSRPFDREAPQVNQALGLYDAGAADAAAELLQDYLTTGACQEGNIGTPTRVRERGNGSFDLGLALFRMGEAFGQRFGEEESDAGAIDPNLKTLRGAQVDCALRIVRAIAEDASQPLPLRARARYLEGNLLFLNAAYKEAVTAYDHALELVPGMGDSGPISSNPEAGAGTYAPDPLGRDAAWNRAIALRRIEDKKDAGQDASPPDGGGDGGGGDDNKDKNKDGGGNDDKKDKDAGRNDDKNKDAGKDSGQNNDNQKKDPPPKDEPDAGAQPPPPSRQSQDERMLDQLENAPTVQQEAAKKHAKGRRVQGMSDK
jgi:hypothetical protein